MFALRNKYVVQKLRDVSCFCILSVPRQRGCRLLKELAVGTYKTKHAEANLRV